VKGCGKWQLIGGTRFRSIVGVIGVTERLAKEAEQENTSMFFAQMFDKLIARQHAALDIWVVSYC
jgi:hypothetical protein